MSFIFLLQYLSIFYLNIVFKNIVCHVGLTLYPPNSYGSKNPC